MSERLANLRHLRALPLIARQGSLRAAAAAANLSQPALTQALARLEATFGGPLFERSRSGTAPTPLGRAVITRVERALDYLAAASARMAAAARPRQAIPPTLETHATTAQLRAYAAVAHAGGYAAAARALGIAQPGVHKAVAALLAGSPAPLLERTSRGVAATRLGEEVAMRASLALRELDAAREDADELLGTMRGRLAVAALPLVRSDILPRAVAAVARSYPRARISILDGTFDRMLHLVRTGEADLLVGALRDPAPAPDVVQETLFVDRLCVTMRAGHPLADAWPSNPTALSAWGWIAPRRGTPTRDAFDAMFRQARCPAPNVIEVSSLVALRGLLIHSDRLAVISRRQIRHEESAGLLVVAPFAVPRGERVIGFTARKDWRPTGLQRAFVAELRAAARQTADRPASSLQDFDERSGGSPAVLHAERNEAEAGPR